MRIGIDAITPGASLAPGAGGMANYLTNLTTAMSRCGPSHTFLIFEGRTNPIPLPQLANVQHILCPQVPQNRTARVLYQNTVYPLLLRRASLDITLGTHNIMPFGSPRPFVVVNQSLQFYKQPKTFGHLRGLYLRSAVRASFHVADAVIAVTQAAKDEAVASTGTDPRKIHVVYHGVFPEFRVRQAPPTVENTLPASDPYILAVSTLYGYKNFDRLIEAYAQVVRDGSFPHRLRIAGADADVKAATLYAKAVELGVGKNVEFLGRVAASELAGLYAGADLFVYPSLHETFGIPPLEAMALGCPVVAARSSSIPEVVGEAAELVNPLEVGDIARGIKSVLSDRRRREELVRRGHERVELFTWERAASATLDVLLQASTQYLMRNSNEL